MGKLVIVVFLALSAVGFASAQTEWPRFRGPNGAGVASAQRLPVRFGPDRNVVWKTALPEGHSSPIVSGDSIFLTGAEGGSRIDAGRSKVVDEGGRLYTFRIRRRDGEILWKVEAPRPRMERYQPTNSAASPSPVTDGVNVFVFFGDFGLLSYDLEGAERWRLPLGPFNNVNGHGSSPILYGDYVILVCDQDTDSYLLAVHQETGEIVWKADRSEGTRSYVTPALYKPADGPDELIAPGASFVASYSPETGDKLWWLPSGGWQPKGTPVVVGEMILSNSWEAGSPQSAPTFEEMLHKADANGDERISEAELAKAEPRMRFETTDLDHDGMLDARDWNFFRNRKGSRSALIAIRGGGRGDLTGSDAVAWELERFLPNVPSPLAYDGVVYLVKDGGIFTALDPETGDVWKQGRLTGALDHYYASPVAGDDKIYTVDQSGTVTVLQAGREWRILASNDLEDEVFATPAIAADQLYLRTRSALYCFRDLGSER